MNKRKSVVNDEQAQACKKLKLNSLIDASDAEALSSGPVSSTPSSSAAPEASASTSASVSANAGVSEARDAHDVNDGHGAPILEPRSKRKATDDIAPSQSGEPDAKRTKITPTPGGSTRRARSPMRLHFKWKDYVPKPKQEIAESQRQWYAAPRNVAELFAAYPQTDSEDERERNGLPSPSSSVHGDAVQQPANALGTHSLIHVSIPRPAPQPEGAAGRNELNSRETVGGHASGSGSTQRFNPDSPGQSSASRTSSASPPPRLMNASSTRHRLNKGKAPATRAEIEKDGAMHPRLKWALLLEKRWKKRRNQGQRRPTDRESSPDAKYIEGFLRSTRSARRGGKCELWYLGDDGLATRTVNKK